MIYLAIVYKSKELEEIQTKDRKEKRGKCEGKVRKGEGGGSQSA